MPLFLTFIESRDGGSIVLSSRTRQDSDTLCPTFFHEKRQDALAYLLTYSLSLSLSSSLYTVTVVLSPSPLSLQEIEIEMKIEIEIETESKCEGRRARPAASRERR